MTQKGFSVLEALVAIALIAVAFLPLLALQGQLARTAVAIERAEANVRDMNSALSYLRVVNPMMHPRGEQQVGDAILTWEATPASPAKRVLDRGGAPGRFDMRLFVVQARLVYPSGRTTQFSVRLVGWMPLAPVSSFSAIQN